MNDQPARSQFLNAAAYDAVRDYLLIDQTEQAKADAILIFGNTKIIKQSAFTAYNLYKQGFAPVIIASGGVRLPDGRTEAKALSDELRAYGVPARNILQEDQSTNTLENVIYSRILAAKALPRPAETILGVGHIVAARRFLMTLQANWPDVLPMHKSVNPYPVKTADWRDNPDFRHTAEKEMAKIPLYLQAGHIRDFDLDDLNNQILARNHSRRGPEQAIDRSYAP